VPSPSPIPGTLHSAAKAFTAKTGIKVNVVSTPWSDYLTKITAAITSGVGPDVIEIGNTWSPTFGRSGGFLNWTPSMYKAVGGEPKFVKTSMEVTGAPGKPAMSVPFLAQTWDMLYNKAMFKKAGLTPPRTWTEFYADAKRLNNPAKGIYAVANDFGSNPGMQTWLWIMARQDGGNLYNAAGQPDFTSKGDVQSVMQMVQWLYPDQIINPANVADTTGTLAETEFETGKAAMYFLQSPTIPKTPPGGYGLSYVPLPAHLPPGGAKVMSHIAGENLAIFKNSKHVSEDLEFIKFLTSTQENAHINQKMGELPVTYAALHTPYFQTPKEKIFGQILTTYAAPMPTEPSSATAFEDYTGAFIKLCRQDITQHGISESQVRSALSAAQAAVAAVAG
jgi:multiple sugar transport system substrate-binding protein